MLPMRVGFCLCVIVGAACAAPTASPQSVNPVGTVPHYVSFSGELKNPEGQPESGNVAVTFLLYDQESGGSPLWTETQHVTLDSGGRYTVTLGANTNGGLPIEVFASSKARWVAIEPEGLPMPGRVLLVSVPYALKAGDAETIGGKPLSAFVLAGTATGTGSDGLTYINPSALATAAQNPMPNSTSGVAGYIGKFVNATDLGNSAIFQLGNNIGIGTTSPGSALTLGAAGTATSASNYGSGVVASNYSFWNGTAAATNSWTMRSNAYPGTNAGSYFQISPGATDPGQQALVFYARQGGGFNFYTDTGGLQTVQSRAATASANYASPVMRMNGRYWTGTSSAIDYWGLEDVLGAGVNPASTLAFQHAGSTGSMAVTLPANAKLGIGVASPSHNLDVNGTGNFTGGVNFGGPVAFSAGQTFPGTITGVTAGAYLGGGGTSGSPTLSLCIACTDARYAQLAGVNTFTGSVGIGVTPSFPLHVNGTMRAETGLSLGGGAFLKVDAPYVAGGQFIVDGSGHVGVNNPTPASALDVVGNISASGGLSIGGDPAMTAAPRMYLTAYVPKPMNAATAVHPFSTIMTKGITVTRVTVGGSNPCSQGGAQTFTLAAGNVALYTITVATTSLLSDSGPLSLPVSGGQNLWMFSNATPDCGFGYSGPPPGDLSITVEYIMQ